MHGDEIMILRGPEAQELLEGQEADILEVVRQAYHAHDRGDTFVPYSTFVRFPDNPASRVIALPAYLGGDCRLAGVKWIASFPGNVENGRDRASAVIVLTSGESGRTQAIVEGSVVSAKRTAAGAALAAGSLHCTGDPEMLGVIGCGLINFEIARFLRFQWPKLGRMVAYDLSSSRAEVFADRCRRRLGFRSVSIAPALPGVLCADLVSIATTAATPHITTLADCRLGTVILHISLRDLAPELILQCENVVDDIDHVCQAGTSIELAARFAGHRRFVAGTLADLLSARLALRRDRPRVFSPFGLGVCDIAVSNLLVDRARAQGRGSYVHSFLPRPWMEPVDSLTNA